MGSGKRLRFGHNPRVFNIGVTVIPRSEHALSIHIGLTWFQIYIGFGKGYDE